MFGIPAISLQYSLHPMGHRKSEVFMTDFRMLFKVKGASSSSTSKKFLFPFIERRSGCRL